MIQLNWSIAKRIGFRAPIGSMVSLAFLSALILVGVSLASQDAFLRIFVVETAAGLQFAMGMATTRTARQTDKRAAAILPSHHLPMLLLLLTPIAIYAYEGPVDPTAYHESIHWLAVIFFAPLSIMIMATSTLLALSEDLTRRVKEAHQTDFLTGLPTRQAFEERVAELLAEADISNEPVTMVLADIDDFKRVNDELGHQAGDAVIAAFGALLRDHVEEPHLVGRVGGEEFCIVLRHADERAARLLALQLCAQFNSVSVKSCCPERRFSASFGVAKRRVQEPQASVYRRADMALYAAKSAGKNRVVVAGEKDRAPANAIASSAA
ncbi:MAG: GGDEF domain-containing protein [Pseudomonadota bacterium]